MSGALWPQLLSSALVGLDKRGCSVPSLDGPLATVLPPGELDADGLLRAAAALTLARRAGVAAADGVEPVLAPPEIAQVAPARAGARLSQLLSDVESFVDRRTRRELIREWLELASGRSLLAPPAALVALADLATSEATLRPLVSAAGGQRLVWLAQHGPGRWAWALEATEVEPGEQGWLTGAIETRVAYLKACRERDPALGRELLVQTWPQEKAADLAALIRACAAGLSLDDEPWLEKALDDRRLQVREAACELLAALPNSGYRMRMAERALACVRPDGDRKLAVTPPAECDAAMRRDGVSNKPPYGVGERAWLLLQVLSAAPLDCWSTVDDDPAKLLWRKVNDDWKSTLMQGWARAAVAQRDPRWALALCRIGFDTAQTSLPELVTVLPAEQAAQFVADAVARGASRMNELLSALPRPWPPVVTEAVLAQLADRRCRGWSTLVYLAETGLAPSLLAQVADLASRPTSDDHGAALAQLASVLEIRAQIHQEFS